MKQIVFTGDWTLENIVGGQRYAFQLLISLDKILSDKNKFEVTLLIPKNSKFNSKVFKNIHVIKRGKVENRIDKYIWRHITFPLFVRKNHMLGCDLAGDMPLWGCSACAILDCIHEDFPENFKGHELSLKLYFIKVKRAIHDKKRKLITLTNESRRQIEKHYDVDDNRFKIIGCGWEHILNIAEDDNIFKKINLDCTKDYYFALGSRYIHKNRKWIIKTARMNPNSIFVISGSDDYAKDAEDDGDNNNIIYTGYLSDEEMKSLMKHCKAFIQPSLCEGFGIPPLEALSLGRDIILSNLSSLPEIYGDSAYYIDPYNEGIKLDDIACENKDEAKNQVLKKYTWANAAEELYDLLNDIK